MVDNGFHIGAGLGRSFVIGNAVVLQERGDVAELDGVVDVLGNGACELENLLRIESRCGETDDAILPSLEDGGNDEEEFGMGDFAFRMAMN